MYSRKPSGEVSVRSRYSWAEASAITFWRVLAARIISVGWPSISRTIGCCEKMIFACGREKRAKISPVTNAMLPMPVKISAVATRCA